MTLTSEKRDSPIDASHVHHSTEETAMKAARIREYKKPLDFEDVPVPDIQPDEVLVKVEACGMCQSDVLLVDGFFQNYANIAPPVIPGHEITGTLHQIGTVIPKAAGLSEGDHVVVAPGWGDGVCRHCMVGDTHICPNVRWPDRKSVVEGKSVGRGCGRKI